MDVLLSPPPHPPRKKSIEIPEGLGVTTSYTI